MERAPLLVNSNRWLAFHDDPNIPTNALSGETKTIVLGLLFGKSDEAYLPKVTLQGECDGGKELTPKQ